MKILQGHLVVASAYTHYLNITCIFADGWLLYKTWRTCVTYL